MTLTGPTARNSTVLFPSWSTFAPTVELALYRAMEEPLRKLPELKSCYFEGFHQNPFINSELERFRRDVIGDSSDGAETVEKPLMWLAFCSLFDREDR